MVVHLPDAIVVRYGDERWRGERLRAFGDAAEPFWRRQERIADLAWDFSARFPALPVDRASIGALAHAFRPRHLGLLGTLGRTVASIMPPAPSRRLAAFVDAQLLITAQTDAAPPISPTARRRSIWLVKERSICRTGFRQSQSRWRARSGARDPTSLTTGA